MPLIEIKRQLYVAQYVILLKFFHAWNCCVDAFCNLWLSFCCKNMKLYDTTFEISLYICYVFPYFYRV